MAALRASFRLRLTLFQQPQRVWKRYPTSSQVRSISASSTLKKETDPGLRLDYPELPWRSAQELPATGWWDNQDRRDKETILHEEDDALNMWMYDAVENNGKFSRWEALGQLATMLAIMGGVYYLSMLYDAPSRNPAVPRQFPFDNLYLERGGDPDKPPSQEDLEKKIHSTYGETHC